ncbi:MAG TPA: ABC transporter permease subunit, partial [Kiloniellales bacterium]|nr:ABC transporter permease subunit [Kiloniellales bacterium]
LAYLVVGVVVVEVVFVYPGIGQLMVDAVSSRDIPVVQACALIFAVAYISLNLLADIVSIVSNPRLLHPR